MAPKAAVGPTRDRQGVVLSQSGRDDPGRSWSLGGPSAAATCGAEETLQRRTRRTHCGRPCDSPSSARSVRTVSSIAEANSNAAPFFKRAVTGRMW